MPLGWLEVGVGAQIPATAALWNESSEILHVLACSYESMFVINLSIMESDSGLDCKLDGPTQITAP